jgi:hypothetical protein
VKIGDDIAEIVIDKVPNKYTFSMTATSLKIEIAGAVDTQSIEMTGSDILINTGATPTNSITIGGSGSEQQLVTKSWLDMIFATHIHPTTAPGAPTLPPAPALPVISIPDNATNHVTNQTTAE